MASGPTCAMLWYPYGDVHGYVASSPAPVVHVPPLVPALPPPPVPAVPLLVSVFDEATSLETAASLTTGASTTPASFLVPASIELVERPPLPPLPALLPPLLPPDPAALDPALPPESSSSCISPPQAPRTTHTTI